jgi:hypothetical protein
MVGWMALQVSSWGSGEASALGELQVVRHTVSRAVPDARVPLHDTLVSALQLAEVRATTHALRCTGSRAAAGQAVSACLNP